jgi:hypothetical protein
MPIEIHKAECKGNILIVVILQLQNDGVTLGSSFSFFYGNDFSKFQGKQMKVLTTASLAASLSPVLLLVWKLLKIPTASNSS